MEFTLQLCELPVSTVTTKVPAEKNTEEKIKETPNTYIYLKQFQSSFIMDY